MKTTTKKYIIEQIDDIIHEPNNKLSKSSLMKLVKIKNEVENDPDINNNKALSFIAQIASLLFGIKD